MKITCVGGGPAGLYFAILMKKQDPRSEITVYERNAPDDTFGWGVVFSDETLSNFEEADRESFQRITGAFARWTEIDICYRDARIRSGGHGFAGISRKKFLQILQERCRELGVSMHFRTEVEDPRRLAAECDLLVGADGVKSIVRRVWEDEFRPSLDVRHARYIWLGTPRVLKAFTFVFRENEHGVFQVHAYPFDERTSTFIVECDEASWKNAGLDRATEAESIAYCEKLFAPELGGEKLLGNSSRWLQFATVRNAKWSHGNAVLIGDAVHTAHFSIGSGTKLAMEDSIALAQAFAATPGAVPDALAAYEKDRRWRVEALQRAAQESLVWFENVKRYVHMDALEFSFSLLTRSRRIGHENLRVRDPQLIERIDRGIMGKAGLDPNAAVVVPPMFTPLQLRDVALENRVVVSPMCMYSAEDGEPNDWHLVHLGSRALGGAGLVFTEMTNVSAEARISPGCAGLYTEPHRVAWKRIVDFVHRWSKAKMGIQLGHAGRKGATRKLWEGSDEPLPEGAWEILAPSALPYRPHNQVPREMTRTDLERVRDEFVRATAWAEQIGFDVLELHYAHGYLMSSFITPLSNRRVDQYGGSLENRMRFPLEVLDAVRRTWPEGKPISVRISATDWVEGGFTGDDAVEVAKMLHTHGCDIVDVSTGQTSPEAQPQFGRTWQTPFSDRIRNETGIPTIAVGAISTWDDVNSIVAAGRADLVALARAHLEDPYFTLHAAKAQGYHDVHWPDQYLLAKPQPRAPR